MAKREAKKAASECNGHEPEHCQPQGVTVYCDGSCRQRPPSIGAERVLFSVEFGVRTYDVCRWDGDCWDVLSSHRSRADARAYLAQMQAEDARVQADDRRYRAQYAHACGYAD